MKKLIALTALGTILVFPVMAQSNDSNLKTQSDTVKGAEKSAEPGMAAPSSGMSAPAGSQTNSGNLQSPSETVKGATDSAEPNPGAMTAPSSGGTQGGSGTNSGNLKP